MCTTAHERAKTYREQNFKVFYLKKLKGDRTYCTAGSHSHETRSDKKFYVAYGLESVLIAVNILVLLYEPCVCKQRTKFGILIPTDKKLVALST